MEYIFPRNINVLLDMSDKFKARARQFDDFAFANYYLELADKCWEAALALDDELWGLNDY